jgi:hypothetical protein
MSQENVETVQRAVEAWNADDLDAFWAELDAEVESHPAIQPGLASSARKSEKSLTFERGRSFASATF